jgi:uncharacterized damage-inducible protein DinB
MDLLDRLLGHDEWTTGELLRRCGELTEFQLNERFDIGHETVRATLVHMIDNVGNWTELMRAGQAESRIDGWAEMGIPSITAEHRRAYAEFAALAREIRATNRWDELWLDTLDDPPQEKSYGGAILHVITHNMHHRGELLHMLARLGLEDLPEGDLMGWEMSQSLVGEAERQS